MKAIQMRKTFPSGLSRVLLRRARLYYPRLPYRARVPPRLLPPHHDMRSVLTPPFIPPARTRIRNGLAPPRPRLVCTRPRANRLLPSFLHAGRVLHVYEKASRLPQIFLRLLLYPAQARVHHYSPHQPRAPGGEKGVRGKGRCPSPPPKHPKAIT